MTFTCLGVHMFLSREIAFVELLCVVCVIDDLDCSAYDVQINVGTAAAATTRGLRVSNIAI